MFCRLQEDNLLANISPNDAAVSRTQGTAPCSLRTPLSHWPRAHPCGNSRPLSPTARVLRVAVFGAGGDLSIRVLQTVARDHRVISVIGVRPRRRTFVSRARGQVRVLLNRLMRRRDGVERASREIGAPYLHMRDRNDPRVIDALQRLKPDLICIAGFPWLLPPSVIRTATRGAINLHTSLLPRHRGPMPLFWLYVQNDTQSGVTVHWVTDGADAGDIIAQETIAFERGESIVHVHERSCERGAALVASAVDAIERGTSARVPQHEADATTEPIYRRGDAFVNFADWDVERVWHVLAGLHPLIHEPLRDEHGAPVRYVDVVSYERRAHAEQLGALLANDGGLELYCRGGVVRLGRAPT